MRNEKEVERALRRGVVRGGGRWTALAAIVAGAGLAGCSDLLTVEMPGRVPDESLSNPSLAPALYSAGMGEFECSFKEFAATAGMMAVEFESATGRGATNSWNGRTPVILDANGGCSTARTSDSFGYWAPMHTARRAAQDGYDRIAAFTAEEVPNQELMLANLSIYNGWAVLLLGEGYCQYTENSGPIQTQDDAFALARTLFTRGEGHAQTLGNQQLVQLAAAGRARALLAEGDLAGAAAEAAKIQPGFLHEVEYSSAQIRRENRWPHLTTPSVRRITVSTDYVGLTLENGDPDPRVPTTTTPVPGEDNNTPWYQQLKYVNNDDNMPLASYTEAQLIIAEANAGTPAAVTAINNARESLDLDLPEYTGSGSLEDVLEERRRTFFMNGHRFVDMLRHPDILPFRTGVNNKGVSYGDYTCIPVPNNERQNNPNWP